MLAKAACQRLAATQQSHELVDLRNLDLPVCDGDSCYAAADVQKMSQLIKGASGILVATPIYNYDFNSAIKNLVELTGRSWTDKVVGFLCAAGGPGSFMAPMSFANSLMLDFHCLIIPRFVYATADQFQGDEIADTDLQDRLNQLVKQFCQVSKAVETTT